MRDSTDVLEQARRDLGLSIADLWLRYFSLGGMGSAIEMEAVLHGALLASGHERDGLAVALDERLREVAGDLADPAGGDQGPS